MGALVATEPPAPVPVEELAGGGRAVRRLREATYLALWLFTFSVPSSEGFLVSASLGSVSRLLGGLAVVAAIVTLLIDGRRHRLIDVHLIAIGFAFWAYLSSFWTIAPTLTATGRSTVLQLVLLFVLLWEFAREQRQWKGLLWAYVLGAGVGALGLVQAMMAGAAFGTGRFSAPGFNPGSQAQVLLLALPLAWYLSLDAGTRLARRVAQAYLPLGVAAILLTAARASLLILPVALAIVPLAGRRWSGQRVTDIAAGSDASPDHAGAGRGPRTSALLIGTAVAALAIYSILPKETTARLMTLQSELERGDLSGRASLWSASVEVVGERPLLGVGVGASREFLLRAVGGLKGPHNSYLAVASELGLIGLGLLLLLLLSVAARACAHAPPERLLGLVLVSVVALGMVPNHSHIEKSTWLALAFVIAPTSTNIDGLSRHLRARALQARAGSIAGGMA